MDSSLKTCFKCGQEKKLSEYYKHNGMADGHLGKCKECAKTDGHNHRYDPKFRDKVLQYDIDRFHNDPERKEYHIQNTKRYRRENPEKYKAHIAVSNAVRDGRLKKEPCKKCGAEENVHGHHEDYSKPLDVIWLCIKCHTDLHYKIINLEDLEK